MKLKIIIGLSLVLSSLLVVAQEVETDIEGGIKIGDYSGDTTQNNSGIIRWNGADFQGWNGLHWRSLTNSLDLSLGLTPPIPDSLPPASRAPSSPLGNTRWTEGPQWSIDGNYGTQLYNLSVPRVGPTDYFPLLFITGNTEWMRMREDGDFIIKRSVFLNTEQPGGQTFNNGPFTVANMSPGLLTGSLKVDKKAMLRSSLEVFGSSKLNSTLLANNNNFSLFPTEFTGAVKISDDTQSQGAIEVGTYPDPIELLVDASTGALVVDGGAGIAKNFNVGGDFAVRGSSSFGESVSFYSPLSIKASEESNTLWVGDSITGALRVYGGVGIRGKLNVGNDFSVRQQPVNLPYTDTSDPIDVFHVNATKGQVTIKSNITAADNDFNNYPLKIEGGNQGIAIKVEGGRSNKNNFVSFWDETPVANPTKSGATLASPGPTMWGRIEGEVIDEFNNNADHVLELKGMAYNEFDAEVSLGFASANLAVAIAQQIAAFAGVRPCAGFPVNCSTSPSPWEIAYAIASIASAGAQVGFAINTLIRAKELTGLYNDNKELLEGVTYASGAGDYAEYLLKSDINEEILAGDIVGMKGGTVSLNTSQVERSMVVSTRPIVLGNMPKPGMEEYYEKIAFIGQVPVNVFGKVEIGDYIVPSGNNDGIGMAISPEEITLQNIKDIVGVAWTGSEATFEYSSIIISVGLNSNDNNPVVQKLEKQIQKQDEEIADLEASLRTLEGFIQALESGNNDFVVHDHHAKKHVEEFEKSGIVNNRKFEITETNEGEVISWEITEQDFDDAIDWIEGMFKEHNLNIEDDIVFRQIKNDLNYKTEMFEKVQERMKSLFDEHQKLYHNGQKQ